MKLTLRLTKIITIIAIAIVCFYLFKIEFDQVSFLLSLKEDLGLGTIINAFARAFTIPFVIGVGILIFLLLLIAKYIITLKSNTNIREEKTFLKINLIWIMDAIIYGTLIYIYIKMH